MLDFIEGFLYVYEDGAHFVASVEGGLNVLNQSKDMVFGLLVNFKA